MLIEHDPDRGTVRVDEDGFEALLSASRGAGVPEATAVVEQDGLHAALGAVTDPLVTLGLVVAGPTTRLSHRIWVDAERAVVLPELRQGVAQLLVVPPGHLAAALVRLARLRPRRTGEREQRPYPADRLADLVDPDGATRTAAQREAAADFAWRLTVGWSGADRLLTVVDGSGGPFLAAPEEGLLLPTTNTELYRLFTTVLPPAALPAG